MYKPREPKLPTRPNTAGSADNSQLLKGEVFRGKFPKVRLRLTPEDVLGQHGGSFSDQAAGVVTRKRRA